jgi:hypothetical protein
LGFSSLSSGPRGRTIEEKGNGGEARRFFIAFRSGDVGAVTVSPWER